MNLQVSEGLFTAFFLLLSLDLLWYAYRLLATGSGSYRGKSRRWRRP